MGSQEDRGVSAARGVTERKRPEAAVRESEARAAADLEAMTKLRDVGALFAREGNLDSVLGEIVDAAIAICGSDFGNIQLLNGETGDLEIVAHRGFPQWWLDFWSTVQRGAGACGTALERGERERAGQLWSAESGSSSKMSSAARYSPALPASNCNSRPVFERCSPRLWLDGPGGLWECSRRIGERRDGRTNGCCVC